MGYRGKRRRSMRLPGYDYSQPGAYFVTICAQGRECLFGHIEDDEMALNEIGTIMLEAWEWLARQYDYVELDTFVVMPNHLHGIIILTEPRRGGSRTAPTSVEGDGEATGRNVPPARTAPTSVESDGEATGRNVPPARTAPTSAEGDGEATGRNVPPARTAPTSVEGDGEATGRNVPATRTAPASVEGDGEPTGRNVPPARTAPTTIKRKSLGRLIGAFKTVSTKRINQLRHTPGTPIWQRGYYEHVIRNEESFGRIRAYIEANPPAWALDRENPMAVAAPPTPASGKDEPWRV